ncbi:MAG TPA: hypothetical protein VGM73_17220 [Candidatus Didemnitutus sp.]
MSLVEPEALFIEDPAVKPANSGDTGTVARPRRQRQHPTPERPYDLANLKIIVVGTPKVGNTWVKHLLSVIYQLPIVSLEEEFLGNDWPALGPRWIGQQHYDPTQDVRAWARQENAVFVAPVRHPADVLVSLRHYVTSRGAASTDNSLEPAFMLKDPAGEYGDNSRVFLQNGFPLLLHLSVYWLRRGWAHAVRYEDIWRFPSATLRTLTDQIVPVPDRVLHHALCACEADVMRTTLNPTGDLVRKGGIGSWREELPADVKELFAGSEPYPDQFRALGYSMDESSPENVRMTEPAPIENPFRHREVFANGVPISPILVRFYFDLPPGQTQRWPDATIVDAGSFFSWLRQPAAADPTGGTAPPVVTELALYLRSRRPDLIEAFPDPCGANRVEFCHWFVFNAPGEFEFDRSFTLPVLASWARGAGPG